MGGLLQGLVNDNGAFTAGADAQPPAPGPAPQPAAPSAAAPATPPPAPPAQAQPTSPPQQQLDPLAQLAAELGVPPAVIAAMGPNQQQMMLQQSQRKKQTSDELQQTQAMIRQAMDPDAVRKYLPNGGKQTARTLLEDMLYNATQLNLRNPLYGSLQGHDYVPIQQQRMNQALKQHQDELAGLTESGRLLHGQFQDANAQLSQYGQMAKMEQVAQTAKAGQESRERERQTMVDGMILKMTVDRWNHLDDLGNKWTNSGKPVKGDMALMGGIGGGKDMNSIPISPSLYYQLQDNGVGKYQYVAQETPDTIQRMNSVVHTIGYNSDTKINDDGTVTRLPADRYNIRQTPQRPSLLTGIAEGLQRKVPAAVVDANTPPPAPKTPVTQPSTVQPPVVQQPLAGVNPRENMRNPKTVLTAAQVEAQQLKLKSFDTARDTLSELYNVAPATWNSVGQKLQSWLSTHPGSAKDAAAAALVNDARSTTPAEQRALALYTNGREYINMLRSPTGGFLRGKEGADLLTAMLGSSFQNSDTMRTNLRLVLRDMLSLRGATFEALQKNRGDKVFADPATAKAYMIAATGLNGKVDPAEFKRLLSQHGYTEVAQ